MSRRALKAVKNTKIWINIAMALAIIFPLTAISAEIPVTVGSYENKEPVMPFYSPANSKEANLLLLIDEMNDGQFFNGGKLTLKEVETYHLNINQGNTLSAEKNKQTKAEPKDRQTSLILPAIPAALFYLPSNYKEEQEKLRQKIETELEQFGVEATPRTVNSLNELKRFNQTVVQDSLIDNLQKQLLISLRGALFSYHFANNNTDKATLTTNDIITNKIKALSGDERVGEYKGYLLALDAYKNKQLDKAKEQFTVLIEAKHVWIAESAKYMLIQIAVDEFNQWMNEHNVQLVNSLGDAENKNKTTVNKSTDSDESKEPKEENQVDLDVLLEQKKQKILNVEQLVNAYQKRYPSGIYLLEVKLKLFDILKNEHDALRKIRVYQMQSVFYEELLSNPMDYEDALTLLPKISEDVLAYFPFAINNPIEKLNKDKAYLIQPINPLLDFIDALTLLHNSKNKKGQMSTKQIEQRIEAVALSLENISQNLLADYLRAEANWKLHKDPKKTLEQIDALNLSLSEMNKTEIFSLFMIKTEALVKLNKIADARQLWELMLTEATPNQKVSIHEKLSAIKEIYVELKLLETEIKPEQTN